MVVKGRVGYVLPVAPTGAPRAVQRALALRREATITGSCPACRALGILGPQGIVVQHARQCPVSDALLVRLLAEHGLRPEDLGQELVVVDRDAAEVLG